MGKSFPLNPGAPNWTQEIERVLKDNEIVVWEWAPIHLRRMLAEWFWQNGAVDVSALTVWQQTCQQLYLPRLVDDRVFARCLAQGIESRDFFALAQGRDDEGGQTHYVGFVFGRPTVPVLDAALLVIEPGHARAYEASLTPPAPQTVPDSHPHNPPPSMFPTQAAAEAWIKAQSRAQDWVAEGCADGQWQVRPRASGEGSSSEGSGMSGVSQPAAEPVAGGSSEVVALPTRFYGRADLDPVRAKLKFAEIVSELIQPLLESPDTSVTLSVEIQAHRSGGFDTALQRVLRENARVLGLVAAELERDDS